MEYGNVLIRRAGGGVDTFGDLDEARRSARAGDVIVKAHRGGHVEYEAAVGAADGRVEIVPQPLGWKPRFPVELGDGRPTDGA